MSDSADVEAILGCTRQLEIDSMWLQAAESYDRALKQVSEESGIRGRIHEGTGWAFFKAAMQVDDLEQFRNMVQRANLAYEKASDDYRHLGSDAEPRMIRCHAMRAYLDSWLSSEYPEKKRFLENSCRLMRKALDAFDKTGDALEYARTCTSLSPAVAQLFFLEWDFQVCERIADEAAECEERALTLLSSTDDNDEIARA